MTPDEKVDGKARSRLEEAIAKDLKQVQAVDRTSMQKAELEASAIANDDYEDLQRKKAKTASLREKNRDLRHNRKLRSAYAKMVFLYLSYYSSFVAGLLLLDGFNIFGFDLSDTIMAALVGSTAASAIGLVYAVTNGLFDGIGKR